MKNKSNLKILLLCDSKQRELPSLRLLKKKLVEILGARVFIVGSLADNQRMFYKINKIRPDVVVISQIQEKIVRDIASYVKRSGGVVCVVPAEITYSDAYIGWVFNKELSCDDYVDFYFLPGNKMHSDIKKYTDISHKKLFVTGSPKMDIHSNKSIKLMSRNEFCRKNLISENKQNIFIFTSFFTNQSSRKRIENDSYFKEHLNRKKRLRFDEAMIKSKKKYIDTIKKLCKRYPNYNFILKPHPRADDTDYKQIDSNNFFLIQNQQFLDTVKSIDLAIHWNSTVSTECWKYGIKTIQYFPIKSYSEFISAFYKGNPIYYDFESLCVGIHKYLNNQLSKKQLSFQNKYFSDWYFKTDGKSSERIAKILLKNVDKKEIEVSYDAKPSILYSLFHFLEKILGVSITRKIIKIFDNDYEAKYSIENYVDISQSDRD